jgi:hypothetical protein
MNADGYLSADADEDGFSFSLNERDWHSYLAMVDAEVGKFFKLFIASKHVANHLDMIFAAMKWEKILFNNENKSFTDDDAVEVVTFHKNPINIAARAIFFFVEKIWDILVAESKNIDASLCWNFSKLIGAMQREMFGGIANIDSYEYLLSVCHFKNVMATVNSAIAALKNFPKITGKAESFTRDFTIALFDIRELAWQSILLCHMAEKNYNDGFHF